MPEISVIIPVHNAAQYLPACIKSLLGQTFADMEFLFVDDASQDESRAVLEEGLLVPPKKGGRLSLMKLVYLDRQSRLLPLYKIMYIIGKRRGITAAQTAMAFCSSKGIVPICGCRKPYQITDLDAAVSVRLTDREIAVLEQTADSTGVKILGADMFRFAVRKGK